MGRCRNKWLDGTFAAVDRNGFWFIHIIGALVIFALGMRFAIRRAPLSFIAYRFIRMLAHR